ncbi:MAG TPA: hypothetical protein VGD97_14100 [Lacunisphaera sp.]
MKGHLAALATVRLGPASASGWPVARLAPDGTRWHAGWLGPEGMMHEAIAPLIGGDWSHGAPVAGGSESGETKPATGPRDAVLARVNHGAGSLALRSGRREPGVRPQFPAAELLISLEGAGGWQDLGYADDPPDRPVRAAALCVAGDNLLAVYLVDDHQGGVECRALRHSLASVAVPPGEWRRLPDYPLAPGVAGVLAGMHGEVLIAAGGANFPDLPPWEGGVKKTYDEIFVLRPGAAAWQPAGRLPEPRAYAAVVSVPGGVLVLGGENAAGIRRDSLLLRWDGRQVVVHQAPALPAPRANPVAVCLEDKVYLAGGYEPGPPRASTKDFLCLDLANSSAGWQALPSWPGPARAQGVMAVLGGAIYLVSGLELGVEADGKPRTNFLTDACRYTPGGAWEKLPDLPWSALAAPTPAPVTAAPARLFVLGGVDGRQSGRLPREARVPEDVLCFDVARHQWSLWPEPWPEPVVTAPAVAAEGRWIFVSGESMAGKRTTVVQSWRPGP